MDKMRKNKNSFENLAGRRIKGEKSFEKELNSLFPPTLPRELINKLKLSRLVLLILVVSLVFILQINQISSIGITPGRTSLNFEPGLKKEIQFSVLNMEHKEMNVVFVLGGVLNQSITLNQALVKFSSSEESKSFSYTVNLPQKIEPPGTYEADILALELPSNIEEEGTFVGATVGVVTKLQVHVPYPNKYLEAELNIIGAEDGKKIFLIPSINRGKLDIVNAKAVIDIYTALNEKVATIETGTEAIASLARTELSAEWIPNVNPGKYMAIATVVYDNEVAKVEKEFNVGEALVEIENLYINDFSLGEIAKFNALVNNKWSNPINDAYLNILVYNNEDQVMADFKSPDNDIPALSKTEMVAYWDTGGVRKGTYDGIVKLNYGVKTAERNIELIISENNIEVSGITGKVLVKGKGGMNTNTLIIILIGVLVIVNVVWFVVVKRMVKKKK